MAIINTGFGAYQKFSVFLLSPPNLFDLALEQKR